MPRSVSHSHIDCGIPVPRHRSLGSRQAHSQLETAVCCFSSTTTVAWIAVVLLLLTPLSLCAQSLPFWTDPIQLDTTSHLSVHPTIAALDTSIFVVWSDDRIGSQELFLRQSDDDGQTWRPEERLTASLSDSVQPDLTSDPRHVHLVWIERTTTSQVLWYRRGNEQGWEPPIALSTLNGWAAQPHIAVTNSYPQFSVYVVWEDITDGITTAMVRVSRDEGDVWDTARPIVTGAWETRDPDVAAGPKVAYLVWRDAREGADQIYFRRWGDYQLEPEVRLLPMDECRRPTISVANEQIAIAWECHDMRNALVSILAMYSQDGGNTWSEAQEVTQSHAEVIRPAIQLVSGSLWLFWQDGNIGRWTLSAAQKPLRDRLWGDMLGFIQTQEEAFQPSTTTSMGSPEAQLHLVWYDQTDPESTAIRYRRRDTIPPDKPTQPTQTDISASPGYDDDDRLTLVWDYPDEHPPTSYRIHASRDGGDFVLWDPGFVITHPPVDYPTEHGHEYRVLLEAFDSVGNASERSEPSATVRVDSTFPSVQIHTPLDSTVLMDQTLVSISCEDENLLSWQLMFGATGNPAVWTRLVEPGRASVANFLAATWDLRGLRGVYTLRLLAQDQAGHQSETRTRVVVDNLPPLLLKANGQEALQANTNDAFYRQPVWSRQDQIAYVSNVGGARDIWVMDLNQRVPHRITQDVHPDETPNWSPGGDGIVFGSFRNDRWQIWYARSDGSAARPLVADEYMNRHPAWSPNGRHLVFASDRDGDYELWLLSNLEGVIQGDSPELFRVTSNRWDDLYPSWSPNGTELVFQSQRSLNWDLFRVQTDGSAELRLTAELSNETQPRWAPDGKQVLFQSDREPSPLNEALDTYVLDLFSNTTHVVSMDTFAADWSPGLGALVQETPGGLAIIELTSEIKQLEARIDRPYQGSHIDDQVEIRGIARGTDFVEYYLAYRRGNGDWQTVGGKATAPVISSGFLGSLDASEFNGTCQIRLHVVGRDGAELQETVEVIAGQEPPGLFLSEPVEGVRTTTTPIRLRGETTAGASVWVNEERVPLSSTNAIAAFSALIPLVPGENLIAVRSVNALGLESHLTRRVIFDNEPPEVLLNSPLDYETVLVPYAHIQGRVLLPYADTLVPGSMPATVAIESNRVSLTSTGVPLADDLSFERHILLRDGTNLLTVKAIDTLGRETQLERRVIYQTQAVILEDVTPPAAVNVQPQNGQILSSGQIVISATLVDDVALDPESVRLEVSGELVETDEYEFDETTGELSYLIPEELADGDYSFSISVTDKSDLEGVATIAFTVDTAPVLAGVSAHLESGNLRVLVASNRLLQSNPGVDLFADSTAQSYSITLDRTATTPAQYSRVFALTPAQQTFRLQTDALTMLGDALVLRGYFSYGILQPGDMLVLPDEESQGNTIPDFEIILADQQVALSEQVTVAVRSQDPLDMERLAAQYADAQARELEPYGIVYSIEADPPIVLDDEPFPLSLAMAAMAPTDLPLALFHWNDVLQRWEPLASQAREGDQLYRGESQEIGSYALFHDRVSPTIANLSPADGQDVPLDRFLVEADLTDNGSGIGGIQLSVDGVEAGYEYDALTGRLVFLPSDLSPGLHRLRLAVSDRALNVSAVDSVFFTQDVFEFAAPVVAFPNPAAEQVVIQFKLTRAATVVLRVYAVSGQLLYRSTLAGVSGRQDLNERFVWNLQNAMDEPVASGVYIYQIEATRDDQTIRQQGKIAVAR